MGNLSERLDNLKALIQTSDFLRGKGLSNEVNIRIFCYEASEELVVQQFLSRLMSDQSIGCRLIECNLYRVFWMQFLRWKIPMVVYFYWSSCTLRWARANL